MPFLDTRGARVHYQTWDDRKDRPWVTLVNGHTRSLRDFRAMGDYLAHRGWPVLCLDNRGSGDTTVERPFTMDDLADDVTALWHRLKIRSSHLLGISLGGMIALTVAARRPRELRSLVLVSTTSHWDDPEEDFSWADPNRLEGKLMRYFSPDFASRQRLFIQAMIRELAKGFLDEKRIEATRLQRRAFQGFDLRPDLSRIAVPTLVLHGGEDRVMPPAGARELAAGIAGGKLEILDGVGHLLLAEAAPRFYGAAAGFFDHVESPAPGEKP